LQRSGKHKLMLKEKREIYDHELSMESVEVRR
jgi:hypothetical protein